MSTNITPFGPVLLRVPPQLAAFDHSFDFSSDMYYSTEPPSLLVQLLARINALRTRVNTRIASAQSR